MLIGIVSSHPAVHGKIDPAWDLYIQPHIVVAGEYSSDLVELMLLLQELVEDPGHALGISAVCAPWLALSPSAMLYPGGSDSPASSLSSASNSIMSSSPFSAPISSSTYLSSTSGVVSGQSVMSKRGWDGV